MSDRNALDELISSLKQERDELRLKMHLAEAEAKDEYERLTARITELTDQYEPVRRATTETGENVVSALKLAAEELYAGLQRVRRSMSGGS